MAALAGRVAVVTGGASGIGRAIARRFAAEGAKVAVADLNADGAEGVAAEIRRAGSDALAAKVDVSDSGQVDGLFQRVLAQWGTVDVLSNNAGVGDLSPELRAQLEQSVMRLLSGERRALGVTSRMSDAEWRRMIEIHLFGTFYCTRAALRVMEEKGRGVIVNMASVAGLQGIPGLVHYSAAKAAIIGLTKALAGEVGPGNIRINVIAPGLIDTPMTAEMDPARRQMVLMRTPLGRSAAPEEVAAVALFLASDEASFVTGQVLSPNGGLVT